jgi:hypothetical protein
VTANQKETFQPGSGKFEFVFTLFSQALEDRNSREFLIGTNRGLRGGRIDFLRHLTVEIPPRTKCLSERGTQIGLFAKIDLFLTSNSRPEIGRDQADEWTEDGKFDSDIRNQRAGKLMGGDRRALQSQFPAPGIELWHCEQFRL